MSNHFPSIESLCRKISSAKLLSTMQSLFPELYDFFPRSYTSFEEFSAQHRDGQRTALLPARSKGASGAPVMPYFICKPNGGCCGRDVVITNKITPWHFDGVTRGPGAAGAHVVMQVDPCVVQDYIDRPLLVNRRKVDLRCYVLVTSIRPLRVYFYKNGIVRMCANLYECPNDANVTRHSVHLANYAINKKAHLQDGVISASRYDNLDSSEEWNVQEGTSSSPPEPPPCFGTTISAFDGTDLKASFQSFNTALRRDVMNNEALMARAQESYAAAYGRRPTPTAAIILANYLVDRLWEEIKEITLKSVLAAQKTIAKAMPFASTIKPCLNSLPALLPLTTYDSDVTGTQRRCKHRPRSDTSFSPFFEVLGFDILVDEALRPWLIEINHSPSWATDSTFDRELKRRVIRDALMLTFVPYAKTVDAISRCSVATRRSSSPGVQRKNRRGNMNNTSGPLGSGWFSAHRHLYPDDVETRLPKSHGDQSTSAESDLSGDEDGDSQDQAYQVYDAEYEREGNGFELIFPDAKMEEKLSEVLKFQAI
jgi:hypothetical protein